MGALWADADHGLATTPSAPAGLYKPSNAARWLDVSRSKVYLLMADGTLPYIRIGNQRRIRLADLEAYVNRLAREAACHVPPTSLNNYPPRLRDLSRGDLP